ncbi:hypothetical protein [Psychromonas antarctica]|uniref:hypothetical protein n=1 Tax=Psychromonas antarctica TaxID=67573 RepID=UPI001EE78B4E|nr:hypothetical protein [Psychromonas antarctica]MCG6202695.1 hypothetical protein [Psychromonas antarctica]
MSNCKSIIATQPVAQLVKLAHNTNTHFLLGLILVLLRNIIFINMPAKPREFDLSSLTLKSCGRLSFITSSTLFFPQNNSRKLNRKVKFDLLKHFIVRNFSSNNTPQAYGQFRLITAQTEGLLVSGGLK